MSMSFCTSAFGSGSPTEETTCCPAGTISMIVRRGVSTVPRLGSSRARR
jgi:hypothetical protein